MKRILKNNLKFIFGIIVGIIITSTVIYAEQLSFASGDVDHTKSDGTKTTVEAALNDLYSKAALAAIPKITTLKWQNTSSYGNGSMEVELGKKYIAVMGGNALYSAWVKYDNTTYNFPTTDGSWVRQGGVYVFTPTESTTVSWGSSAGSQQSGNAGSFALIKVE